MCTLEANGPLEIHLKTSCDERCFQSAAIESEFLLQLLKDASNNENIFDWVNVGIMLLPLCLLRLICLLHIYGFFAGPVQSLTLSVSGFTLV